MKGAIIGDVIGSRFEWENIKTKEFELFAEGTSDFTDDSVLTLDDIRPDYHFGHFQARVNSELTFLRVSGVQIPLLGQSKLSLLNKERPN